MGNKTKYTNFKLKFSNISIMGGDLVKDFKIDHTDTDLWGSTTNGVVTF